MNPLVKELPKHSKFNELLKSIKGKEKNISSQDIEIQLDIWAEDSVTASTVLSQVEEFMRSNLYIMSFSNDVPNVSDLHHIVCRFAKLI